MKSITVTELKALQASGEPFTLIDVREQNEFNEVNMNGILIPKSELETRFTEIPKEGKVIVHCKSGMRSATSIQWLEENEGYDNLYNLQGGIIAWLMGKINICMNNFGRLFKVQIFGESHGESVGILIDGCPAGLKIDQLFLAEDLERRKGGTKGTTPRKEEDIPLFKSGVFQEKTTGTPILIQFENKNTRSEDYNQQRSIPRPGHADFVAHEKFGGNEDYRGGGHFSARLTTGIVAAGNIAKQLLRQLSIEANITEIAGESNLEAGLQKAIDAKDTVGGIIECRVQGLPIGLGEPFFDSVESLLAHAMFAIPAVKGIEFGAGFAVACSFGSQNNDSILNQEGSTKTNHAGGINGGITNGNELIFRIAIKPASSTPKEQESWNRESKQMETFSIKGRHDLCVALRAPVIVEAMTAIVLADLFLIEQRLPRVLPSIND